MTTPPSVPHLPPLLVKGAALAAVLVALAGALGAVSSIVSEREGRLREAEASVAASLASSQTVLGPLLQRDCVEAWETVQGEGKDRKTVTERRAWKLAAVPESVAVKGSVAIEPHYRGIFKVKGYVMNATLAANWADGAALLPEREHPGSRLQCDAPSILVALGDSRGVRSAAIRIDGAAAAALPGTGHEAYPRGFHVGVAEDWVGSSRPLTMQVEMAIVGTGELGFAPVGKSTRVDLASDWQHPSFTGRFVPVEKEIGEHGFNARWALNALATTAPEEAVAGSPVCVGGGVGPAPGREAAHCVETFGVSFIDPVSTYTLSDRATKYGLLFIALTFVGVGAVEVMRRVRVHPIQYLLVGAALALFFLLLVSLSEHLPFDAAYLAASGACTLLLAFYGRFVLGGTRAGLAFGAAIGALYGVLYVLLQLEQRALLFGSLLLFAVLAAAMVATRRIDWYALLGRIGAGAAPATTVP